MTDSNDDLWTTVPSKKSRRVLNVTVDDRETRVLIDKDATVESLSAEYVSRRQSWAAGPSTATRSFLRRLHLEERPTITKVACLGISNFNVINLQSKYRSMVQLVLLKDLVDHLDSMFDIKLAVYMQDPRFTDIDKAFLTSLGMNVVDFVWIKDNPPQLGPIAEHIDEHTFVVDFFTEHKVTAYLADYKMGLLLSALAKFKQQDPLVQQVGLQRLMRILDEQYVRFDLPRELDANQALSGLAIRVPRLSEMDE